MINLVLGFITFLVAGLGLSLWAANRAPAGFEDEQGFHFGPGAQQPCAPAEDFAGAMPAMMR